MSAQGLIANAQISAQPAGKGLFDYTITLTDSSASTSPIVTFWYAWSPGGPNYLFSSPLSAQAPPGWGAIIGGGESPNDGYSIRFESLNAPILPGTSANFSFTSADPPASVNGESVYYPGVPAGTSIAYSGHLSGAKDIFVVEPIPEPQTMSLILLGLTGLGAVGWRRLLPT